MLTFWRVVQRSDVEFVPSEGFMYDLDEERRRARTVGTAAGQQA